MRAVAARRGGASQRTAHPSDAKGRTLSPRPWWSTMNLHRQSQCAGWLWHRLAKSASRSCLPTRRFKRGTTGRWL